MDNKSNIKNDFLLYTTATFSCMLQSKVKITVMKVA